MTRAVILTVALGLLLVLALAQSDTGKMLLSFLVIGGSS